MSVIVAGITTGRRLVYGNIHGDLMIAGHPPREIPTDTLVSRQIKRKLVRERSNHFPHKNAVLSEPVVKFLLD